MLVLTRKAKQSLKVGNDVTIHLVSISGNTVKIGIDAPPDILVLRGELAPQQVNKNRPQETTGDVADFPVIEYLI